MVDQAKSLRNIQEDVKKLRKYLDLEEKKLEKRNKMLTSIIADLEGRETTEAGHRKRLMRFSGEATGFAQFLVAEIQGIALLASTDRDSP